METEPLIKCHCYRVNLWYKKKMFTCISLVFQNSFYHTCVPARACSRVCFCTCLCRHVDSLGSLVFQPEIRLFLSVVGFLISSEVELSGRVPDSWSEGGGFDVQQKAAAVFSSPHFYFSSLPPPCYCSSTGENVVLPKAQRHVSHTHTHTHTHTSSQTHTSSHTHKLTQKHTRANEGGRPSLDVEYHVDSPVQLSQCSCNTLWS